MTVRADYPVPELSGKTPQDQANAWLVYLNSGGVPEEGRKAFSTWLRADATHARAYAASEQVWRDLGYMPEAYDDAVAKSGGARKPFAALSRRQLGVAAAAALVFAGIAVWQFGGSETAAAKLYASRVGEVKTVRLEDGSTVTLGAASTISVTLSKQARSVVLERGRAYFEVAHDANRPFSVNAGAANVTVLGTIFDIARNTAGVRVSVVKGVVMVAPDKPDASDEPVHLTAGQRLEVDTSGALGTVEAFKAGDLAWRMGRLVFHNESLAQVVEEINRYRTVKIALLDEELGKTRITISIPANRTDQLLSVLEATEPIGILRTGNSVTVRHLKKAN